jgi:hypothetical protein
MILCILVGGYQWLRGAYSIPRVDIIRAVKVASYIEQNKEMCYGGQAQPVSQEQGKRKQAADGQWKILAMKRSALSVPGE